MKQIRLLFSGPYLGFFVCGGKLRLREQTPQTFTGISRIQTGFSPLPPPPPAMYGPDFSPFLTAF